MITFRLLDNEVYFDGTHIADFDDLPQAKEFAYNAVNGGGVDSAIITSKFTGEILYTADAVMVRKVKVGN